MTPTPPVIFVPASKLSIAATNVRKHSDPTADAELKASIAARGVIQNLIGLPVARKKGEYRITAGGRRLTQVRALIDEGIFGPDYTVPVMVLADKNDATEVSLVENFVRLNMSPAEECRAFQAIIDGERKTPADVAKRFTPPPCRGHLHGRTFLRSHAHNLVGSGGACAPDWRAACD